MDYNKWMEEAKNIINTEIEVKKTFEVKSLFPKHKWDTLEAKEKRAFGRYFANEVREKRVENIRTCEKGKDGHCRYIKV